MIQASQYSCHAFHESLPGGKASGELTLSQQGLTYRIEELGGSLPFARLQLKLGGAANRLVFITHPNLPDLTLYTSDLSILKNPILQAHPESAPQVSRARKTRAGSWAILIGVTALFLTVPLGMVWQMDRLSAYAAKQIPVTWETKLGAGVAAQYDLTHTLMPTAEVDTALKPLTAPLLAALPNSPYRYTMNIVNDGSLNAFALPGGYVTINSGLILKAGSAEELQGVLAHEISHVEERHGVRSIIGNTGIYLIASTLLGDVSGLLATVSSAAPMLLSQEYSRSFETDADEKGVALLQRAKINPAGLPRFFERMIAEEKAMLDKIENQQAKEAYKSAMSLLSTHPASEKRMAHLRTLIGTSGGPFLKQEAEFKALQEAVKKFVALSPPEASAPTSDSSPKKDQPDQSNKENTSESKH